MKVGIIGLGFMGATHLGAFSKLNGVEVAAVCARNPRALAGDLSQVGGNLNRETGTYDFSAVHKYSDWRELVADPALDAVDICLPTDAHTEVSLAALAAGKHVLCEKPMALTKEDCGRMISAAEKHRRILMVAQVLRFWPEYQYLEQFVKNERNSIASVTFSRRGEMPPWSGWLTDESRSGGAVLDLLVHDIDQAIFLFGVPEQVSARSLGEIDTIRATLQYPGNTEVHIEGGWFPAGTPFSMAFTARTPERELDFTAGGLRLNAGAVEVSAADAYETQLAYFVECCEQNKQPERCLPQDSAKAVALALLLQHARSLEGKQLRCEI